MSVQERTMFYVACDGCGKECDNDDYVAWADAQQAIDTAREWHDWLITEDEKHFCPNCTIYDEATDQYQGTVKRVPSDR